ncbi:MAG: hypothetical protein A7316_08180 [Candidatus Altiarchaeales archaeon WOR_SM1_86-2]|nr:MAG: hypothetical protein A7316_08180 [Candidatus Altiarchaeales archaeon WOR_SM1_86-2]ODS40576.1 MAG: hypothetical protein A7315_08195 [Candidatus Altiarchaeales archaeon WOR_SM1_79]
MKLNPYDPRQPTEPEFFIGREEYIEKFNKNMERTLYGKKPTSFAILGEWGVGKSSLLLKLKANIDKNKNVITTRISIGSDIPDYYAFCQLLVDKINIDLTKNRRIPQKIRDNIFEWKFKEVKLGVVTAQKKEKTMYLSTGNMLLEYNLKTLFDDFISKDNVKLFVLFIDDLHNITRKDKNAIAALRDLFQSLAVDGYKIQLVFTASSDLFHDVKQIAEPAVRFFEKFYLDAFSMDETKEFLTKPMEKTKFGITFANESMHYLHKRTNGHPYFLAFITQRLVDLMDSGEINVDVIEKYWELIFKELIEEKFERDVSGVSPEKEKLLVSIANREDDMVVPKDVGGLRKYYPELTHDNLLKKVGRGKYRLYHPLFKEYLKTKNLEEK